MRFPRNLLAALSALVLLLSGCLEAPPEPAPPPKTSPGPGAPEAAEPPEEPAVLGSGLDELEQHARRVTLRVRNIGCGGIALGSGFAVAGDTLVTNRHVIAGAERLEVNTWDGRRLTTEIALSATSHDLALVRVIDELPEVAEVADADPEPGAQVVVASYPGGGELVVRRGQVLAHTEDLLFESAGGAVALDVPLSPGSSGGPVLGEDGRLVGVIYAVSADGGTSFGVPASALRDIGDEELTADLPPCPG